MADDLPPTFVPGFHDEEVIRKMEYQNLGYTDLKVSRISLGTGGFSYFYGDVEVEECKKIVYEAVKKGVNFIDTAPWYGHGVSEEILGKCLENIPRNAYYIATKVGRYEKDPHKMFDFSAKKVLESVDTSLRRLNLDYIDLIQVHDIEFAPSMDVVLNETLPTLENIVKDGKAQFIGITGYPVKMLLECIEKSPVTINSVLSYCRLSMVDDTLLQFIPNLKERHIGVINAAANAMGLLVNSGPPDWHPASEEVKTACREVADFCKTKNVELGRLAVYFALQQKGPDTTLVGMNNVKYVGYNLDILYNGLSDKESEVYEEVKKILASKLPKPSHWENVEVQNYWETINSKKVS